MHLRQLAAVHQAEAKDVFMPFTHIFLLLNISCLAQDVKQLLTIFYFLFFQLNIHEVKTFLKHVHYIKLKQNSDVINLSEHRLKKKFNRIYFTAI